MFNKMMEKRAQLKATLSEKKGFQKGFTLIEMLVVLLILAVLIAVLVMQFGFLSKVDGTELIAESKNVESAILQVALSDADRNFPGVSTDGVDVGFAKVGTAVSKRNNDGASTDAVALTKDEIIAFMTKNGGDSADAKALYTSVVTIAGADVTEDEFAKLVHFVNPKVDKSVAGSAETGDYLVVVKKSQISAEDATNLGDYSDEIAGTTFSNITIKDSDNKIYNGTNTLIKE